MFNFTSTLFLSFLPLILAKNTCYKASPSYKSSAATTTATILPCPTPNLPPETAPYFYLKTNTFNNPCSNKNNLFLSDYHVEAGASVAVLVPEINGADFHADLAYLNDTYLQLAIELAPTGGSIYWYLLPGPNQDEVASAQMIEVFGGDGVGQGYYFNDTDGSGRSGLKYHAAEGNGNLFVGWLACDWFGTAGTVQLIPQFSYYWEGGDVLGLGADGVLPANCEAVELVQEFVGC